jgi:hypothetical protein
MDTFDEIEKIKRAIRSSHAVMFNMNTMDVDLDEDHQPVFKPRNRVVKSNEPIEDESPRET